MIVRPLVGVLAAALLAVVPGTATAALVVTAQPSAQTVLAGSTGFFDVFVTSTALPTAPDLVAGYTIDLETTPTTGLTLTGVTSATLAPNGYIFPASSPTQTIGPGPNLQYIDSGNPTTSVSTAEIFGAGRIAFSAITPGIYTIAFDTTQSGFFRTDLTDIPTSFIGTTITVLDPAAIPEPSSMLLLGMTGIAAVGLRRLRRKSSETTTAA